MYICKIALYDCIVTLFVTILLSSYKVQIGRVVVICVCVWGGGGAVEIEEGTANGLLIVLLIK
jgi:hypothetical protein